MADALEVKRLCVLGAKVCGIAIYRQFPWSESRSFPLIVNEWLSDDFAMFRENRWESEQWSPPTNLNQAWECLQAVRQQIPGLELMMEFAARNYPTSEEFALEIMRKIDESLAEITNA